MKNTTPTLKTYKKQYFAIPDALARRKIMPQQ